MLLQIHFKWSPNTKVIFSVDIKFRRNQINAIYSEKLFNKIFNRADNMNVIDASHSPSIYWVNRLLIQLGAHVYNETDCYYILSKQRAVVYLREFFSRKENSRPRDSAIWKKRTSVNRYVMYLLPWMFSTENI